MTVVTQCNAPSSERLSAILDHLEHVLPAQGPIGAFVHHNTLHAFEDQTFEDGVVEASKLFGTEPYMREEAFRKELARGRILPEDIDFVLAREPNAVILDGGLDRTTLRRAILTRGLRPLSPEAIEWTMEEGDLLTRFRSDMPSNERSRLIAEDGAASEADAVQSLFQTCLSLGGAPAPAPCQKPKRPRDGILAAYGVDLDDVVHPLLVRLCAVYLDQGQSYWPMPRRELGMLRAVRDLLSDGSAFPEFLSGLDAELRRQERASAPALDVLEDTLSVFGVEGDEIESVLQAEVLALPGWAGLIRRLEKEPELAPHERPPFSLADFLALRMTLVKVAAANVVARFGGPSLASAWRSSPAARGDSATQDLVAGAHLMDVAQILGLSSARLRALDARSAARLVREVEMFDSVERRRLYQLAYERRHEKLVLNPIVKHARRPKSKPGRPAAQVFFCIDEREESTRRALEESDPEVETFAAAGYFGVAVDYTGIDDAHGAPLCPAVIKPQHAVIERPNRAHEALHQVRTARRKLWAQLARGGFVSSRTLVSGWLSAAVLGLMSLFPLTARVLAPRSYARLRKFLNRSFLPEPRTELVFMRDDETGRAATHGLQLGFSVAEKVDRVESVLAPAGLRERFARIVVILGHGSTSLNNPHESAHDCGACGGRRGGPNARLFAAMANSPRVRAGLAERGIRIPDDTWFVGGYHDTCNDDIELYDLDVAPASHHGDLARIRRSLDKARAYDAHERSRRFEAAGKGYTPEQALRHVEERSEHLAEPRPEYGHCTNAIGVVGNRATTRGLFFDRRAFLTSYDAATDPDDQQLSALLSAVIPVCAGISLEYYFSFVDNEGYGCGTKLPHNVTGLIGVMNGHAGDLRTGLPWQMVEIHEPVRILFVVETTPERLMRALQRIPGAYRSVENRWVRLAAHDPETGLVSVYRDGVFEPFDEDEGELPSAASSAEWYQGRMEHLPFARIEKGIDLVTSPMDACSA